MLEKLKIIVPTCDKYTPLVEALMYSVEKHWGVANEFIILGYEYPKFKLNNNWYFISLGQDTGPENWSNDLLKFFEKFEDEYFINMIDDTVLTRKSDTNKIQRAFDYMKKYKDVKKCFLQGSLSSGGYDLLGDISYTPVEELNGEFVDINQMANYRTSIQSAIWATDYFLQILKPNLSPWDFELQHVKNDGARILTTLNNHPIMFAHLASRASDTIMHGWKNSMYENTHLSEEDVLNISKILKF